VTHTCCLLNVMGIQRIRRGRQWNKKETRQKVGEGPSENLFFGGLQAPLFGGAEDSKKGGGGGNKDRSLEPHIRCVLWIYKKRKLARGTELPLFRR